MKRILLVGLLIVVVGVIVAYMPEGGGDAKMLEGAKALDARFAAAMNKGDVDAIAACYWNSPDVVMFPPDAMEVHGIDALKAGFAEMMKTPGMKFEYVDSHQFVAGDVVVGYGKWKMSGQGPDGNMMEMTGRYTDIKKQVDGKWVFIHDHASVPMMMPEMEEEMGEGHMH